MSVRLVDLVRDRGVLFVLGVAAVVRAVVGLDLWSSDPLARVPLSDPAYYHAWASALAAGESFRAEHPFWLPPLYPWLLSLVYRVTGPSVGAALVVQSMTGVATTLLLVLLAWRAAGRRAALAAGLLWTFYLPVVFFETRLLAVNAALPLCAGALALLVRVEAGKRDGEVARRGGPLVAGLAGLLLGAASMARPNLLLAAPFVGIALLASGGRRIARLPAVLALLLGLAIGIAPSAVANHARSGEWIAVTANGGVNFWFGNNEDAHGTFHAPAAEWGSIGTQRDVSVARATRELGRTEPVTEREASAWWFRRGLDFLRGSPGAGLRLWGLKLADTLTSTELGIQYFPAALRRLAPSLWIEAVPFGLLLALGVLGLRGGAGTTAGRAVLTGWLLAGLAASLAYFTYSRFRLPILLAWMPFAGRGAVAIVEAARYRQRLPAARVALALALLALSYVPFEGDYPRLLAANTLLDAGLAARDLGDDTLSRDLIEESLELVPINPRATVELARLARAHGDEREAVRRLELAWSMPGAYPFALFELTQLLLGAQDETLRDPPRAVHELRDWLATAEPDAAARLDMMVLLATALIDRPELAQDPDEARELVREVLRIDPDHGAATRVLEYLERP